MSENEQELPLGAVGPSEVASQEDSLDVKQLGLFESIRSLGYVFWIVGLMEMVERLAFYGTRSVATLYGKDPVSKGGLGVTPAEMGILFFWWMIFQSWVPVFTGGIADRYGYKKAIFASTVLKIVGYLIMSAFPTYGGFFAGALVLALGTAIFKPGIQGTLVKCTNRSNSSMAWGIFYQTVNIGAFMGPLLAGYMRKMEWRYVFLACAAIICLNFLLLLTYREPGIEDRLAREEARKKSGVKQRPMIFDTLGELFKPHLFLFVAIFSGFYFMFYSLFDVLPNYIDDWVNSSDVVASAGSLVHKPDSAAPATLIQKIAGFVMIVDKKGEQIQAEGIMNVNAGMIMLTCFFFGYLSSRVRITTSIWFGTGLATLALLICGSSTHGWLCIGGIICFSAGEMLSSPKFSEFVGNLAPADKKGTYLGLCQIAPGIGAALEGYLGLTLYGKLASKEAFARQMLSEKGFSPEQLKDVKVGEAFDKLVSVLGQTPQEVTQTLWQLHHPELFWYVMASVGVCTTIGLIWYGSWVYDYLKRNPQKS